MTRADDERTLLILADFARGRPPAEIGPRLGMTRQAVAKIITRIREADIAYDPEAAAYWQSRGRRT